MTLDLALKLGKDCGFETVGEALLNISLHSNMLFEYEDVWEELSELGDEFEESGLSEDDKIEEYLNGGMKNEV